MQGSSEKSIEGDITSGVQSEDGLAVLSKHNQKNKKLNIFWKEIIIKRREFSREFVEKLKETRCGK